MRTLFLLALSAAFAGPATTCALDDCTLSDTLHTLSDADAATGSAAWMLHDLAEARQALRDRNPSRAARLASELHLVVNARADIVGTAADAHFLMAMHEDLTEVITASGWAAPEAPTLPYMDQAITRR